MSIIRELLAGVGAGDRGIFKIRVFFIVSLFTAVFVQIIGAFAAETLALGLKFISLNLTLGGAAGLAGGVLGFIFGIPRSRGGDPTPSSSGAIAGQLNHRSRTNTNLEQISDWLTRILVGATLASLAALPDFFSRIIQFLDLNGYADLPGQGTMAVFIAMYFLALGFYWSYLETRTYITSLFDTYQEEIPEKPYSGCATHRCGSPAAGQSRAMPIYWTWTPLH
jgi:hypothetical protein